MAKDTRMVLAEELHRILEDFRRVEAQAELLAAERKRLATIAQRLLHILRMKAPRGAERLLAELGLADVIARLPGVPGRKPTQGAARKVKGVSQKAQRSARGKAATAAAESTAGRATASPTPLPKGTPMRMLVGKYKGWTGIIRWLTVKGSTVSYTVNLVSGSGQKGRNQVRHGSLGTTWEQIPAGTAVPVENGTPGRTKVSVPKRRSADKKKATGASRKKTDRLTAVQAASKPSPAATTAITTVRRRRSAAAPVKAPEALKDAPPVPAARPSSLPQGILPKGTPIRMLTGIYLGYTGVVASVQALPGPKPDAVYTLALKGPGGAKGRTSVKQGSLGRTWVKGG